MCGTLGGSASHGGSTVASSRLSYQWPANVSINPESNSSTPSRARYSGGALAGYGVGGGLRGAHYAAGKEQAASCWYRNTASAPGGGHAGSSSSSMVSLHNVRLSSWGSLPSRSSSSPAHPTTDGALPPTGEGAEPAGSAEAAGGAEAAGTE